MVAQSYCELSRLLYINVQTDILQWVLTYYIYYFWPIINKYYPAGQAGFGIAIRRNYSSALADASRCLALYSVYHRAAVSANPLSKIYSLTANQHVERNKFHAGNCSTMAPFLPLHHYTTYIQIKKGPRITHRYVLKKFSQNF